MRGGSPRSARRLLCEGRAVPPRARCRAQTERPRRRHFAAVREARAGGGCGGGAGNSGNSGNGGDNSGRGCCCC